MNKNYIAVGIGSSSGGQIDFVDIDTTEEKIETEEDLNVYLEENLDDNFTLLDDDDININIAVVTDLLEALKKRRDAMRKQTYAIVDDNGNVYAHDIINKLEADTLLEFYKEKNPAEAKNLKVREITK